MPRRHIQLCNGEIYHIVMRRIENNLLFIDTNDYYRGIFSIYEFNTTQPVEIRQRRESRKNLKEFNGDPVSAAVNYVRDKLVEILSFCFMPNHIHLLLKQLKDNGITRFLNKFGAGYPAYFRRRHGTETGSPAEKGYFFQGRFVSVHIKTDTQLKTVFAYIHTNPIALVEPRWKDRIISDPKKAIKFLEDYKWSSYPDYIGKENFPSVTDRKFILEILNSKQGCRNFINDWIKYKGDIKELSEIALE